VSISALIAVEVLDCESDRDNWPIEVDRQSPAKN